ncbi:hypothetical protein SK128_001428 [Halocaridina rubra]|uniref:Uncharacterized protein n=1 Tax=Halocaridina rubra TaxID=373956 RepID=A0AAN9AFB8_HALRR
MLDYGDFVPEALATSADSQLLALGKKLDLVPLVSSLRYLGQENCMDKVFDTQYAQLEGYSYVQLLFLAMGYGKDVYFVKEQIYKANMAFFFKKNTPWKYKFDKGIMRLVESGLIHKWYDDIMAEFQKDSLQRTEETVGQPLSLAHLQGPFLLLVLGMLLALLIFLVEHIHH